jgi:hypothetical protein
VWIRAGQFPLTAPARAEHDASNYARCPTRPTPIGVLTVADWKLAFDSLGPLAAFSRNKYLQVVKALDEWGNDTGQLTRRWLTGRAVRKGGTLARRKGAQRHRRLVPDPWTSTATSADSGWSLHHVQMVLGHADLKQTSTYLNASVKDLHASMHHYGTQQALRSLHVLGREQSIDPPPSGAIETPSPAKPLVN